MAEFMSNSDAFTWAMEADPRLRSTIVSLLILDERPDWDAVTHRFDRLSRVLPVFRQRVVASPVLAPPRWEYDPDFDLDYHVRRIAAPPPRTPTRCWSCAGSRRWNPSTPPGRCGTSRWSTGWPTAGPR